MLRILSILVESIYSVVVREEISVKTQLEMMAGGGKGDNSIGKNNNF